MLGRNNSVVCRLKQVQPCLIDLGCICHLETLYVVGTVRSLPVSIDDLLVDIPFPLYSVKRKAAFREYHEFCRIQMQRILKPACYYSVVKSSEVYPHNHLSVVSTTVILPEQWWCVERVGRGKRIYSSKFEEHWDSPVYMHAHFVYFGPS